MSRSTTETLVRILGLYYLAEGAISIVSSVIQFVDFSGNGDGMAIPRAYFWTYFFGAFPLAIGILVLMYSKPLARWMQRDDSVASDA
jgi:dipeptide/tripeptide permease